MGQRANLDVIVKDKGGDIHVIACGHWHWGGYTSDAVYQLGEFGDVFKRTIADAKSVGPFDLDLKNPTFLHNIAASVFKAMGGTWHCETKPDGTPCDMSEPVYWHGEEDMKGAPDDVITEVEIDVTDPDDPKFYVGGSFIQPKLSEEMDDCEMDIDEMLEEGKLVFVYDPLKTGVLSKALAGEPLTSKELETFGDLINEHPFDGGGVYAMPGSTEDSDVLVIIGG
jgi:hypothetical protein